MITVNSKSPSITSRSLLSYSICSLFNTSDAKDGKKVPSLGLSSSNKIGRNALLQATRRIRGDSRSLHPGNEIRHWLMGCTYCVSRSIKIDLIPAFAVANRPITGTGVGESLVQTYVFQQMGMACNTLGHLSAVYCVLFDMSGRYIFTVRINRYFQILQLLNCSFAFLMHRFRELMTT